MKVKKDELKNILALVRPGLAKKEILQQALHFIFTGTDVVTYNDKICISHPFPTDFPFSVRGEEFYKIISTSGGDIIEITEKENGVKIESVGTKASLSSIMSDRDLVTDLISSLKLQLIDWYDLPEDFAYGASLCAFSASRDQSKGVGACVAAKDNVLYAYDGKRASRFTMSEPTGDFFFLGKDVEELVKFPFVEFSVIEGWIGFRTLEGVLFACRKLEGEYPFESFDQSMDFFADKDGFDLPKDLKTALIDSLILSAGEGQSRAVDIEITDGQITCSGTKEIGWIEKRILCAYKGDPLKFTINPLFLSQVLDKATMMIPDIPNNRVYFRSGNFEHLIMLVRV